MNPQLEAKNITGICHCLEEASLVTNRRTTIGWEKMDILLRVTWLTTNKKHTVGLGNPSYLWIQISILPGNYRDATKEKQSIGKAHWWIIPSLADAISMWGRVRSWTAHFKSGWHVILGSFICRIKNDWTWNLGRGDSSSWKSSFLKFPSSISIKG